MWFLHSWGRIPGLCVCWAGAVLMELCALLRERVGLKGRTLLDMLATGMSHGAQQPAHPPGGAYALGTWKYGSFRCLPYLGL